MTNNILAIAVIAASFAAGTHVSAAVEPMPPLRPDHPRIFFNRDMWPAMKARAEGAAKKELADLMRVADAYPADPKCADYGPVTFREITTADGKKVKTSAATPIKNMKDFGAQAARCALAWRFAGKSAHLEKAKKMLLESGRGYRAAYANGREVHWYAHNRVLALAAYDWIYEALTDDERRAIIVPLVEHVEEANPAKGRVKIIRRNGGGINTGFYGVPCMLWYSGLAAAGDGICDELAAQHLQRGWSLNNRLLDFRVQGAGDDGALSSATTGYALGHYPWAHFNFIQSCLSATGLDMAERHPALALFPNWVWWTWIPNAADPMRPFDYGFGDGNHETNYLPNGMLKSHLVQYLHYFAKADPDAARLAAALVPLCPGGEFIHQWPHLPFILDVPAADAAAKTRLEESPVKARHFETLGQIFMRSGWKGDSTYALYTSGGTLLSHRQFDDGNFVIFKHDFLALDSGTRAQETDYCLKYYYSQTVAHNCVLVHRPGEPLPIHWGPASDRPEGKTNYGGQVKMGAAKTLAFETNARYSYAASDLTPSYGPKCRHITRQFVHVQPDYFVVYDRVDAADAAYRKDWLLHAENEPQIDGRRTALASRHGRLFCETLLPEDAQLEKVGGPDREFLSNGVNWPMDAAYFRHAEANCKKCGKGPYFGQWRLEVKPGAAQANDRFLHVMTVGGEELAAGVKCARFADATRDGVMLELPGGEKVALSFNRDGEVGGEIAFGDEKRPLAATVQPQKGVLGF